MMPSAPRKRSGPLHGIPYALKDPVRRPTSRPLLGRRALQNQASCTAPSLRRLARGRPILYSEKQRAGALACMATSGSRAPATPSTRARLRPVERAGSAKRTAAGLWLCHPARDTRVGSFRRRCGAATTALRPTFGGVSAPVRHGAVLVAGQGGSHHPQCRRLRAVAGCLNQSTPPYAGLHSRRFHLCHNARPISGLRLGIDPACWKKATDTERWQSRQPRPRRQLSSTSTRTSRRIRSRCNLNRRCIRAFRTSPCRPRRRLTMQDPEAGRIHFRGRASSARSISFRSDRLRASSGCWP